MKKKVIYLLLLLMLTVSVKVWFDREIIIANVPNFTVNLVGHSLFTRDEEFIEKYPVLIYNGVLYFALTYEHCQLLGLESNWTSNEGLVLTVNPNAAIDEGQQEYTIWPNTPRKIKISYRDSTIRGYHIKPYESQETYQVKIATEPVTILGYKIDNSKEKYPLLSYQNVTYLPLTWHWMVDTLGLFYQYNDEPYINNIGEKTVYDGLLIHANVEVAEKQFGDNTIRVYYDKFSSDLTQNIMVKQNNGTFKTLGKKGYHYGYDVSIGYGNDYGVNPVNAQWQRQNNFYVKDDWLYINSNSCLESRTISVPCKIHLKNNEVVYLE